VGFSAGLEASEKGNGNAFQSRVEMRFVGHQFRSLVIMLRHLGCVLLVVHLWYRSRRVAILHNEGERGNIFGLYLVEEMAILTFIRLMSTIVVVPHR